MGNVLAQAASRFAAAMACVAALCACSSIGGLAGAVTGVASGAATSNPAVGVAIGIGVQAGVDESINTVLRYWSQEEQAQIASLVGEMKVGERRPWEIRHAVPYGNAQGEVTVARAFKTSLAACKEAVFSVGDVEDRKAGAPQPHFVTVACQGVDGWKWATAEPSVSRWGALQ
jgi:hypothetical protein